MYQQKWYTSISIVIEIGAHIMKQRTRNLGFLAFITAIVIAGSLLLTSQSARAGADPCEASPNGPASDALSTEYALPTGVCAEEMAVDSNGNLWFTTNPFQHNIAKRTPGGTVTVYPIGEDTTVESPVADNSGNIWFRSYTNDWTDQVINKITSNGTISSYPIPQLGLTLAMAKGPDGNIWIAGASTISKMAANGSITTYDLSTPDTYSSVYAITAGPDGNIWYLRNADGDNSVGKITTGGVITETTDEYYGGTMSITSGPDGNLWLTKDGTTIIKMTTSLVTTEYTIPTENPDVRVLTTGSDGNIWFTEHDAHKIGRISPAGVIVEYNTPTTPSYPRYYATGPNGEIWYNQSSSQIGKLQPNHLNLVAQNNATINVTSPLGTDFTCHDTKSVNDVPADPGYTYPVGLVSYCINVEEGSTQELSVTFQTNLSPSEVVLRKYNSVTEEFGTIVDVEITQAEPINGNPAVTAVYSVTDGGELDEDSVANGVIVDPVGMAVSAAGAPNAGIGGAHSNQGLYLSLLLGTLIVTAGLGATTIFRLDTSLLR